MRILLVEDDKILGSGLRKGLIQHDNTVDWVEDGKAALDIILTKGEKDNFDIIILDLGLPNLSGIEILKTIRAQNVKTPVLILTAYDSHQERILGLDMGADDYVCKPFDLGELCARMRALQRRTGSTARAIPNILIGDLTLDPATRRVYKNGQLLDVSRREYVLFHLLLENMGRVMTREQITQNLYGWGDDIDSNALEVHIHNLRKKIGGDYITTIRGVGYMIDKSIEEKTK
jgi:two-component system, OmpR family, response regulator QseB